MTGARTPGLHELVSDNYQRSTSVSSPTVDAQPLYGLATQYPPVICLACLGKIRRNRTFPSPLRVIRMSCVILRILSYISSPPMGSLCA